MSSIFISHASDDLKIALSVCEGLEKRGVKCWITPRDIRAGENCGEAIIHNIESSSAVLLLLSERANQSIHVRNEIERAVSKKKQIFVLRAEDSLPSKSLELFVSSSHRIDLWDHAIDDQLTSIADTVRGTQRPAERLCDGSTEPTTSKPSRPRALMIIGLVCLAVAAGAVVMKWGELKRPAQTTVARVSLPAIAKDWPAFDVLKTVLEDQPPQALPEQPLAIDVDILAQRTNESSLSPIKDGESLRSRVDNYLITITPLTKGFLYVFQIDSAGNVAWLFPKNGILELSCGTNPIKLGRFVRIPDNNEVLYLDDNVGVEQLFVVFSLKSWPKLKQVLADASSEAQTQVAAATQPLKLELRGVGGRRPRNEQRLPSELLVDGVSTPVVDVIADDSVYEGNGAFMVLSRWFRHTE